MREQEVSVSDLEARREFYGFNQDEVNDIRRNLPLLSVTDLPSKIHNVMSMANLLDPDRYIDHTQLAYILDTTEAAIRDAWSDAEEIRLKENKDAYTNMFGVGYKIADMKETVMESAKSQKRSIAHMDKAVRLLKQTKHEFELLKKENIVYFQLYFIVNTMTSFISAHVDAGKKALLEAYDDVKKLDKKLTEQVKKPRFVR